MANRTSDWQGLLESFNETLAPQGKVILVEQNEDESGYNISVSMPNGKKELYAEGYYEDELCGLLNDALSWAIRYEIPEEGKKHKPEKVIVLSVTDSDNYKHILHVYKGKDLSEIRGEDLLPALREWADDDYNCQESDEDELRVLAEELATKTMAYSESDREYELDYVALTTF